jgi:D-alanine transfer protein
MRKPLFLPLGLAVIIVVLIMLVPNGYLIKKIPEERVSQAATELNPFMFQGKYIQEKMMSTDKYLPIYGSSELSRLDRFHPSNYFEVTGEKFTPFLIGRGGSVSLVHFLAMAEHKDKLKGKKLVFIISPQWFQPDGALEAQFAPNYSSLHGYDFAFNKEISPSLKKRAIKRLLEFQTVSSDPMLSTLYESELSNGKWIHQKARIVKPIANNYRNLLIKKDLYYVLLGGKPRERSISKKVKNKSWEELNIMAEKIGKKNSRSNNFKIVDSQYEKMRMRITDLKDSKIGASYGISKEYDDFQLVLDLLKEAEAEPLFISIPVNGDWYDYTGFPRKGRTDYYKKIRLQIEKSGFAVADFSDHEYDPYFMKDSIHIGWKGWVYTDKAIKEFYERSNIKTAAQN